MNNIFKKTEYFEVDYSDLNDFLINEYELEDFECALEQSNDSVMQVLVDGNFSQYEDDELKVFLETKRQYYNTTSLLLNDLCRKGKIEKGNYLIEICW